MVHRPGGGRRSDAHICCRNNNTDNVIMAGVYVFGVLGAIYGPLALCVLYVIINVYSTFITDSELDDTPEVTRAGHNLTGRRSTLVRSGTVG